MTGRTETPECVIPPGGVPWRDLISEVVDALKFDSVSDTAGYTCMAVLRPAANRNRRTADSANPTDATAVRVGSRDLLTYRRGALFDSIRVWRSRRVSCPTDGTLNSPYPLGTHMARLDRTDAVILESLLTDARRSYRDIADEVGLSPPAVSNRVDRLRDLGVIQRFTVEVDRTKFANEDECLAVIDARFGQAEDVFGHLQGIDGIEHVFVTADSTVVAKAVLSPSDLHSLLTDTLRDDRITEYEVTSVLESAWQPRLGTDDLALECTICGNSISDEGDTVEVESGETYRVCCSSCAEEIVEQYESLKQGAEE